MIVSVEYSKNDFSSNNADDEEGCVACIDCGWKMFVLCSLEEQGENHLGLCSVSWKCSFEPYRQKSYLLELRALRPNVVPSMQVLCEQGWRMLRVLYVCVPWDTIC